MLCGITLNISLDLQQPVTINEPPNKQLALALQPTWPPSNAFLLVIKTPSFPLQGHVLKGASAHRSLPWCPRYACHHSPVNSDAFKVDTHVLCVGHPLCFPTPCKGTCRCNPGFGWKDSSWYTQPSFLCHYQNRTGWCIQPAHVFDITEAVTHRKFIL